MDLKKKKTMSIHEYELTKNQDKTENQRYDSQKSERMNNIALK